MSKYIKLEDIIKVIGDNLDRMNGTPSGAMQGVAEVWLKDMPTIEVNEDAISREWIKNALLKYGFTAPDMTVTELIEDAPPVIPKPKEGEWIEEMERHFLDSRIQTNVEMKEATGKGYHTYINQRCSICNKITMVDASIRYGYCPHCGADMRGESE